MPAVSIIVITVLRSGRLSEVVSGCVSWFVGCIPLCWYLFVTSDRRLLRFWEVGMEEEEEGKGGDGCFPPWLLVDFASVSVVWSPVAFGEGGCKLRVVCRCFVVGLLGLCCMSFCCLSGKVMLGGSQPLSGCASHVIC